MKTKNLLFLLFIMVLGCWQGYGQTVIGEFSSNASTTTSNSNAAANASTTGLSRGASINAGSGATFNSTGWTTTNSVGDAIANNDYIEWTITASIGFVVSVSELQLRYDRSGTGPAGVSIRTSLDSYASDIFTDASVNASGEDNTISGLTLTSSSGGSITFRLYGYNASSASGTFDIEELASYTETLSPTSDNVGIVLRGTVTSSGVSKPEPSNQPTAFTASVQSFNKIQLSWTNAATGAQAPDGYLIVARNTNTLSAPVDGTDPATDSDLSDGSASIQVVNGAGTTATFTGLASNTQYYFQIWSFTNGGSNIDFKTAPAGPTSTATTGVYTSAISAQDILINEVNSTNSGNATYVELLNTTANAIDLSGLTLEHYNNGSATPNATVNFSNAGVLASGSYFIVTRNLSDFSTVYTPVAADLAFANMFLNGGEDGVRLIDNNNAGATVDQFNDVPSAVGTFSDNHLYYRVTSPSNNGSDINNHWIDKGVNLAGSPKSANPTDYTYTGTWDTDPAITAPASVDKFLITSGTAVLASSYTIGDLTVAEGAKLDIGANTLTVNGTATINASAAGYGQVKGNIAGTVVWQTYLTTTNTSRWYNVGVPVSAAFSSLSFTNGSFIQANGNGATTNLWEYNASNITSGEGTWEPLANLSGNTTGKGYSVYLDATNFGSKTTTVSVSGSLLNGVQTQVLQSQGTPAATNGYGWNFVANPYAASIDWNAVVANNANITTTYWVLNANGNWVAYNQAAPAVTPPATGAGGGASTIAPRYIASGQAFFVQSNTATSLSFAETDIALSETPGLLKTTSSMPASLTVSAENKKSGNYDFTFVAFTAGDTDANDKRKDAIKRFNNTAVYPALYSTNGKEDFIFNFTDDAASGKAIALNFEFDSSGVFDMNTDLSYFPTAWSIELEDKLANTRFDLRAGAYTFNHTIGNKANRFVLHVNKNAGSVGIDENNLNTVFAYTKNNLLHVNLEQLNGDATVTLFDINGKVIAKTNATGGTIAKMNLSAVAHGVYVAKVTQANVEVHTQKVIK